MPSDPFADQDDDDQNQNFIQLREAYAALEKDLKSERKAREAAERKITEAETQRKTDQAATVFKQLNLNPLDAEFYLLKNPEAEVTEDAVREFAVARGWAPQPPPSPEETEEVPAPAAFVPVAGNPPPTTQLNITEFKALYLKDPNRALSMVDQGLVDLPSSL